MLVNNAGIAVIAPLEQFSLEDFDRSVAYLASPEAGFVTGACLTIDGGFAA